MATDAEIETAVRDCLAGQLPDGWGFVQNYQSTAQARHSVPTVYFARIGERPMGQPGRTEVWNPDSGDFDHYHVQQMEATVRVQGFAPENDADPEVTSADVAAQASMALQTDYAIARFRSIGAQPLRIVQLPGLTFENESDEWEKAVTFDFVLSHSRAMVQRTPSASLGDLTIYAV